MRTGEKAWVIRHTPTGLEVAYHYTSASSAPTSFVLRPKGQGSQIGREYQLAARIEAARALGLRLADLVLVRYETIETVEKED